MDGRALVRACRADDQARDISIIAISAMHGGHAVRDLDVQGFRPKPFSLDTLLDVLRKVPRTAQLDPFQAPDRTLVASDFARADFGWPARPARELAVAGGQESLD